MAVTLFLRPSGLSKLQVPPSPVLSKVTLKKQLTFDAWNTRVSKNYGKKEKQRRKSDAETTKEDPEGYYRDNTTEMSLVSIDPPLRGKEKYLGGELGLNGKIYTVPGHALRVLVIDPSCDPPTVTPIGPEFLGEYKWLRAIRAKTGILYAIPCHADSILRIDSETNHVSTISWSEDDPMAPPRGLPWKWHGGNISSFDDCLYCIPQFAERVLKLNTITEEISFMGGPFPGRNKWYGGLIGERDGAIYGICQNATGVLRIDAKRQTATVHGEFPQGGYKWHGGVVAPNGTIFGVPAHADRVLKVSRLLCVL
jgi:hypothetical protein